MVKVIKVEVITLGAEVSEAWKLTFLFVSGDHGTVGKLCDCGLNVQSVHWRTG